MFFHFRPRPIGIQKYEAIFIFVLGIVLIIASPFVKNPLFYKIKKICEENMSNGHIVFSYYVFNQGNVFR